MFCSPSSRPYLASLPQPPSRLDCCIHVACHELRFCALASLPNSRSPRLSPSSSTSRPLSIRSPCFTTVTAPLVGFLPPSAVCAVVLRRRACFSPVPDARFTTLPGEPCPATVPRGTVLLAVLASSRRALTASHARYRVVRVERHPSKTSPRRQPVSPHDDPCPPAVTTLGVRDNPLILRVSTTDSAASRPNRPSPILRFPTGRSNVRPEPLPPFPAAPTHGLGFPSAPHRQDARLPPHQRPVMRPHHDRFGAPLLAMSQPPPPRQRRVRGQTPCCAC